MLNHAKDNLQEVRSSRAIEANYSSHQSDTLPSFNLIRNKLSNQQKKKSNHPLLHWIYNRSIGLELIIC